MVYVKDITKRDEFVCDLYSTFLTSAKSIGFDRDRIDKLISILDHLHYGKYIEVNDISVLKGFMSDISAINEAFFYEYDETVEENMIGLINKINNAIKED